MPGTLSLSPPRLQVPISLASQSHFTLPSRGIPWPCPNCIPPTTAPVELRPSRSSRSLQGLNAAPHFQLFYRTAYYLP